MEAYTYRWKGHVGHRDDIDVGVKRGDELSSWKERDPIKRLFFSMENAGIFSSKEFNHLLNETQDKIDSDWLLAEKAEFPNSDFLFTPVYYNKQ